MWVRLLKRAGIGFLLGIVVGNLITWIPGITSGKMISPDLIVSIGSGAGAMAVQTLVMGLYGALAMGGMTLYEIERWPLAMSTAVHYLIIAVSFVVMDLLLRWNSSPAEILVVEAILLAVFSLIWLIMFLRYRSQVRRLNAELRKQEKQETHTITNHT